MSLYRDMAAVLETLPDVIRRERTAKKLSFRQAAEQIGISHTAIWRYESGVELPNSYQLLLILQWLDPGEG